MKDYDNEIIKSYEEATEIVEVGLKMSFDEHSQEYLDVKLAIFKFLLSRIAY